MLLINGCSVEPINERDGQNLSFSVVLDGSPSTKAESLGLYTQDGKVTFFTLEQVPQTKSVQINHGVTFTEIYDSFQVEGRENNNRKFYDYAQYNSSTGLWDLQNSSYLWQPGHVIEIVAAASGRNNEQFFTGIRYNGNPSTASFNYSLPETQASQQDYLIGYYKGEIADGTVSLKFNHPLTSLVFEVGPLPLGVTLQVNSITLEGIDAEAICDVTFGENTTYVWRAYSGTTDYTQVIETPEPKVEGDDILDETASFIVIPRTFPANSEARILLNITENGREYDMYAPLAGQVWNPGETNIYQLSYHGEKKAVLADGPTFNNALATVSGGSEQVIYNTNWHAPQSYIEIPNIKKIKFQIQSSVNSGTLVNVEGERPIYMNYDNVSQTVTVSTSDYGFYTGPSVREMFCGLVNLQSIEGLNYLDTRESVDYAYMFAYCKSLNSIDVHNFNTEKATSFLFLFGACEKITSIDLSSFKTDNVTSASYLFFNNKRLLSINFGNNFQLRNCTGFSYTFSGTPITSFDLSFIEGSTAPLFCTFMFADCKSLQTVIISKLRGDIQHMWGMFGDCRSISTINFGSFQTFDNLQSKDIMFEGAAYASKSCNIICTEAAWNKIRTGTGLVSIWFTWTEVPLTPTP